MHRLENPACDHNRKLLEVARALLNAEEVFAAMEQAAVNGSQRPDRARRHHACYR